MTEISTAEGPLAAYRARRRAGELKPDPGQELTAEKLRLVRAVQRHQSLLARLQFEVGGLLRFEAEGTASESATFDPSVFVSSTSG